MKVISILLALILCIQLNSCTNREKNIDIKLPAYQDQMTIECYLIPGQPFRLSILESVSYFASPYPPTVDSAFVTITHNGIVDTLPFNPQYDPINQKLYNYISTNIVPQDYTNDFNLYVKDKKGRIATSQTKILPAVPIDTVYLQYHANDTMASAVTIFHDNLSTKDYYRFVIKKNTQDTEADQQIDDINFQTSKIELPTEYDIPPGTVLVVSLYHITQAFYDFYQSTLDAKNANGNPFGQPSVIKSNISGGIGIFTGLDGSTVNITAP